MGVEMLSHAVARSYPCICLTTNNIGVCLFGLKRHVGVLLLGLFKRSENTFVLRIATLLTGKLHACIHRG